MQVPKEFEGRAVVDKGAYLTENDHDRQILAKYIHALAQGDHYYKPASLKPVKPN